MLIDITIHDSWFNGTQHIYEIWEKNLEKLVSAVTEALNKELREQQVEDSEMVEHATISLVYKQE